MIDLTFAQFAEFSFLKDLEYTQQVNTGQMLFHKGDPAIALFAIKTGRIRLVRYLQDGSVLGLHIARAGETFAEAALFSEVYHCDAIADSPSQVVIYPKSSLIDALRHHPESALHFMALLTHHVQSLRTRLELCNIRSARDRVLACLSLCADSQGAIAFDRALKDIASDIGLTHEVFYRTLSQLEKEGIIARKRRFIQLVEVQ
ncbi:MAG TPA: Crp/Fnr family transcriptional regulator [Leptolyngbyaceae cyanobacterium M33_DOE_097]|nr:Crp/Fnr family transcriptional regulator [Leptolyngbyaceae cyanobacterium M33_DOE_097]